MANETDPDDNCNFTDSTKYLNKAAFWSTYAIFMPCYVGFGLVGRSLALLAFYHQAKEEKAYLFQIFLAAVELFEVFSFGFYTQARYMWSGLAKYGEPWFMKCWLCMYADAHLHTQAQGFLCSLMLSLCMTLDRIYALAKPMQYSKKKDRKKQQWAIFIFCIFLSMLSNLPGAFYVLTVWHEEEGQYRNEFNTPWRTILINLLSGHFWLKLIVTLGLIAANIFLAIIYGNRMSKRHKLTTAANKEKEEADMQKVRTLFWLTFIQATLDLIAVGGEFIYNILSWLTRTWPSIGDNDCISTVIAPFTDGLRALVDMGDFYLVFALMPSFRRIVIKSLKHTFNIGSTKVTSLVSGSNTGSTAVGHTSTRSHAHA